jgi:transcriptional regulator with XRE-family HTH domain
MSDHVARRVGQRMREIRLSLELTQAKVGELAGFTAKYINEIEAGRRPNLPLSTLVAIAEKGLKCSLSDVFQPEPRRARAQPKTELPSALQALAHELARLPAAKRKAVLKVLRAAINAVD